MTPPDPDTHDDEQPARTITDAKRDTRRAYDGLTRPTRPRLAVDDAPWIEQGDRCVRVASARRYELPSLLDQLIAAVQSGRGGTAHGVHESKPPLDSTSLSLLLEIAGTVADGCRQRKIKRSFDTRRDLGALVEAVNAEGDVDRVDACAAMISSWCARIKVTISNDPDRTWRMHGAACTVCGSTSVPVWDTDGTEARQPAMIVHSDAGRIERVTCDFCGTVLSADELTVLVQQARRAADRQAC